MKHNVKSIARRICRGTVCPICLVQHHTRDRLIHHMIRSKPICLRIALHSMELMEQEEADLLDMEERKRR